MLIYNCKTHIHTILTVKNSINLCADCKIYHYNIYQTIIEDKGSDWKRNFLRMGRATLGKTGKATRDSCGAQMHDRSQHTQATRDPLLVWDHHGNITMCHSCSTAKQNYNSRAKCFSPTGHKLTVTVRRLHSEAINYTALQWSSWIKNKRYCHSMAYISQCKRGVCDGLQRAA